MKRIGAFVLALAVFVPGWSSGDTLHVEADAQTSSGQPTVRFGGLPAMGVRQGPGAPVVNAYARFDLSALPAGADVRKATLRVWILGVFVPGAIEVVPVAAPWEEGSITASNAPALGTPVGTFTAGAGDGLHFAAVDVTALVRDWVDGSVDNNGLALRAADAQPVHVLLDSKESVITSHAPELEVALAGGDRARAAPPCFDNVNRFVDCGNGTVTDTVSGLVWLKNADCFGPLAYAAANEAALGLADGDCGLADGSSAGDWRLPTRTEWELLMHAAAVLGCSPAITDDPGIGCLLTGPTSFINLRYAATSTDYGATYWTSTTIESIPGVAWGARPLSGSIVVTHGKGYQLYYAWPVRGGR